MLGILMDLKSHCLKMTSLFLVSIRKNINFNWMRVVEHFAPVFYWIVYILLCLSLYLSSISFCCRLMTLLYLGYLLFTSIICISSSCIFFLVSSEASLLFTSKLQALNVTLLYHSSSKSPSIIENGIVGYDIL